MAIAQVLPSNYYKFSAAKQTAFGSAAANPDYQIPVYDADAGPDEGRTALQIIEGQNFSPGEYKDSTFASGEVQWASHPDSNGRLLAMHFGTSSDTVTGAGDPRTHTFARKDVALPHTVWVGRPASASTFEYDKLVDVIAKTLKFQYTNGQLFRIATTLIGGSAVGAATAPAPTNTIVIPTAGNYGHTWARATLKLDLATTPAATTISKINNFEIVSSYDSAKMVFTQNLAPDFYDQGLWSLGFSASIVLANWNEYNNTFYGTTSPGANTAQSGTTVSGALDFTIDQEPTATATRALQIQIPYIQFKVARPKPNADGSGITANLAGVLSQPASGEPITVKQLTSVATSYS